ncbi:AAA family ATPase [Phenylobacterium sp. LjRoot219]|uniref:AAA family ATPase n=1 Tax=Phenylobacterium sp. LjRoot219 TaxID=3342283 RepID=UPI003ECE7B16
MLDKPNFFVLTGGPGVGKTALLHALRSQGEFCVEESARAVIREQLETGGRAVPWIDPEAFAETTARRDIAQFDSLADETGRVFFDRGILDSYRANGVAPSPLLIAALRTRRYNRRVFVAPPWREIYQTDAERRQDWAEAEATFGRILSNLDELGYEAVVLPKTSVEARVTFVLTAAA